MIDTTKSNDSIVLPPALTIDKSPTVDSETNSETLANINKVAQDEIKESTTPKKKRRLMRSGSLLNKMNPLKNATAVQIAKVSDEHAIGNEDKAEVAVKKAVGTSENASKSSENKKANKPFIEAKKNELKHWKEAREAADKAATSWKDAINASQDVIEAATDELELDKPQTVTEKNKVRVSNAKKLVGIKTIKVAADARILDLEKAKDLALERVKQVGQKISDLEKAQLITGVKVEDNDDEDTSDVSNEEDDQDYNFGENNNNNNNNRTNENDEDTNLIITEEKESDKTEKEEGIKKLLTTKTGCCSNWDLVGIVSKVVAVVGVVLAAFGALCLIGIFPTAFVGGLVGAGTMTSVGVALAAAGLIVSICHNPKSKVAPQKKA